MAGRKPHYSFMRLWSIKVPTIIIPRRWRWQETREITITHTIIPHLPDLVMKTNGPAVFCIVAIYLICLLCYALFSNPKRNTCMHMYISLFSFWEENLNAMQSQMQFDCCRWILYNVLAISFMYKLNHDAKCFCKLMNSAYWLMPWLNFDSIV